MKRILTDIDMANNNITNIGNIYTKEEVDQLLQEHDLKEQIVFSTYFNFPNIGKEDILYIARDEAKSYIWDTDQQIYVSIQSDVDFQIIQCAL